MRSHNQGLPDDLMFDGHSAYSRAASTVYSFRETVSRAPGLRSPTLGEPWAEWSARSWCMDPKAQPARWSNGSAAQLALTGTVRLAIRALDARNLAEGISASHFLRSALADLAPLCHREGASCYY